MLYCKEAETYNKKILVVETAYPYIKENYDFYSNMNPGYEDTLYYPI